MVKYRSKGNLPQTADYYALLNRSGADWRDSVRQGLVFSSAGAGCLNYGNRSLITTSTSKMRWQFRLNTVAGASTTRYICGEYNPTGNKRGWEFQVTVSNRVLVLLGNNGGTAAAVNSVIGTAVPASGDLIDIKFESGIFTMTINGANPQTLDASGTQTVIYNNNSPDLNVGGSRVSATSSYNGSLCCFKIWVDNILDTDTPKFVAPLCDKTGRDIISGTKPSVVGTVDMTARSDTANFYGDEYGFAVKSGEIYLKKYSGTGYAGLVGEPDKIYYPGPYPNTFTGNWHELTHAYFDKSNTDIWEDFIRESINYISEEPTYWNVDEISQDYFDKYIKAAYRDKIYCGLGAEDDDYRGAVMVFESGVPAALLPELTFWRKRKGFPVDRRVAWVDIDTPITLTAGASGTITGRGYFAGQHIEVEVRLSGETPEDDWTPFGTATVAGDGSWTVSGTIASADTYDFRVIDENIDPAVCSAQVDDVVVASGATLTAFQFGATGAIKGDVSVTSVELNDNYIYISGWTAGSTLFDEATGVNAGVVNRAFIAKFDKTYTKKWVKFFDCGDYGYRTGGSWFVIYDGYMYAFNRVLTSYPYNSTLFKLSLSDGSTVASLALTQDTGCATAYNIGKYNGKIYLFGATGNIGSYMGIWEVNTALDTQTLTKNTSYAPIEGSIIAGQYAYAVITSPRSIKRINLADMTVGADAFTGYTFGGKNDISPTNDLIVCTWSDGANGYKYRGLKKTDLTSGHFDKLYKSAGTTGVLYQGKVRHNGSNDFIVWRNDGAKFILEMINDDTAYGFDSTIANITPYSLSGDIVTFDADCHFDNNHYVVVGKIKNGVMENGHTPIDVTKYEGFIKLIER